MRLEKGVTPKGAEGVTYVFGRDAGLETAAARTQALAAAFKRSGRLEATAAPGEVAVPFARRLRVTVCQLPPRAGLQMTCASPKYS